MYKQHVLLFPQYRCSIILLCWFVCSSVGSLALHWCRAARPLLLLLLPLSHCHSSHHHQRTITHRTHHTTACSQMAGLEGTARANPASRSSVMAPLQAQTPMQCKSDAPDAQQCTLGKRQYCL